MDSIKTFTDFISFLIDNSVKVLHKVIIFLVIIASLIMLDSAFGFSYYYNINQKTAITSDIQKILESKNINDDVRKKLSIMNNEVLLHQSLKERVYQIIESDSIFKLSGISLFFYIVSGAFMPIALSITGIIITITELTRQENILVERPIIKIKRTINIILLLLSLGLILIILESLIPLFLNYLFINYIINIIINSTVVIGITKIMKMDLKYYKNNPKQLQAK